MTFIDTPGVLAGEKQTIKRGYEFSEVVKWFAERADRIILLFDAHKLDISDEFKDAIEALRGNDDKIRCVLNKADMVGKQELMRVYGSLMWSLGKVLQTPEVLRVYIGSFWDQPLARQDNADLFQSEEADLIADLRGLPRNSALRKINELVKRARQIKVHVIILDHLRNQFGWFGKSKTQENLLSNLLNEFKKIQALHSLPVGDFPHVNKFRETLRRFKISQFPKMDQKMMQGLDHVLSVEMPKLMKMLPSDVSYNGDDVVKSVKNPFATDPTKVAVKTGWIIDGSTKARYDNEFYQLPLVGGMLQSKQAYDVLMATGLPQPTLKVLWELADIDQDGKLDNDEFAIAIYLTEQLKKGILKTLPDGLPLSLVPPSKRIYFTTPATIS